MRNSTRLARRSVSRLSVIHDEIAAFPVLRPRRIEAFESARATAVAFLAEVLSSMSLRLMIFSCLAFTFQYMSAARPLNSFVHWDAGLMPSYLSESSCLTFL